MSIAHTTSTTPTAPFHVLVIEDDLPIGKLVQVNLQKAKIECRHASSGQTGLMAFAQDAPHLVLLDLNLPDMTGYDICAKIRKSSNVPIIMMTARCEAQDQLHGLKIGADDYITKPFDVTLLVARVVTHLRRAHRYNPAPIATTAAATPADWNTCNGCGYMGPKKKFEEMNAQFQMMSICPNCSERVREDIVLG